MESGLSVSRQTTRGEESTQDNSHSIVPKPHRVKKFSKQLEPERAERLPPPLPVSTRLSITYNRKSRRPEHGGFISMISTIIQGRILVSPWPDDPAEDPPTGATKNRLMRLNRTGMKARSSGKAPTKSRTSSAAPSGRQQLARTRIPALSPSVSAAPQPEDTKPSQQSSAILGKRPQGDHHRSSPRPMSQAKEEERAHDSRKRKGAVATPTTASPLMTARPRLLVSRSTETATREGSGGGRGGGGGEEQASSSVDSVESFNLETYRPPMTKARRTAGQILEDMVADSDSGAVSSSLPSLTSSVALAAGIEDIEGYLEEDLRGFSKLSY